MTDSPRDTLRVAVVLTGREGFGVRQFLLNQRAASDRHDLAFEYVCLQPGPMYETLRQMETTVTVCGGDVPTRFPLGPIAAHLRWLLPNGGFLAALGGVRRTLQTTRVDVAYAHAPTLHLVCGLAARAAQCAAVGQLHGPLNPYRLLGINRAAYCSMMHLLLDKVITISSYARSTLCGPLRRSAAMIYNGADLDAIRNTVDTTTPKEPLLVLVGRLVNWKKQEIAIHAMSLLRQEFPECKLELVGGPTKDDNPHHRRLRDLIAKLHLTEQVTFAGVIAPPYRRMAAASACLSCATTEAFGYTVVEAMACGTPVVVADRGAPAEFVQDGVTGLHYQADNPEALAAALRTLFGDAGLGQQLAKAAWTDVRDRFGVDTHLRQIREVFVQCVKERHERTRNRGD